ncbi:hypothetical protein C8Q80DRAFT_1274908 [Daedaleopsis nitida]|nr:hypothetical protein C8Q80DRAFT_1274908 [Daedaleopsis nitida]
MSDSPQAARLRKLHTVTSAVSESGFRSVNDFLLAFYTSKNDDIIQQAHSNLRYSPCAAFGPEKITGESRRQLHLAITRKAADIMVEESTKAYQHENLRISASGIDIPYLSTSFSLTAIWELYQTLLPCLCLLLHVLLSAPNHYERDHGVEKQGKGEMVVRVSASSIPAAVNFERAEAESVYPQLSVDVISMLLFGRNRATDAFQLVMGLFLSSAGASRRVIDTLNHMGLSVSYQTVQRSLATLSERIRQQAREYIEHSGRLTFVVYDNINFTLRKYSQRIDSMTEQLNATTLALVALPARFTHAAYAAALSITEKRKLAGLRSKLTLSDLELTPLKQSQMQSAFEYHIGCILLDHLPTFAEQSKLKFTRRLRRKLVKHKKPCLRLLDCEQTKCFPLPALNKEEASVRGTIRVVEMILVKILGFAIEAVDAEL